MGNNRNPICQCPNCRNLGVDGMGVKRRGGGRAFLCEYHVRGLESYYTENNNWAGKSKAHRKTFGVEFETDFASKYARLEFMLQGFLPTRDISINGPEFKSPIMNGKNALKAWLPTIDELLDSGDLRINWDYRNGGALGSCGTHTHVGHLDLLNVHTMGVVRKYFRELFTPLCLAMLQEPEKVERVFGRNFVDYAEPLNRWSSWDTHSTFINLQHDNTLEWRICVYRNAAQYSHCVDVVEAFSDKVFSFCDGCLSRSDEDNLKAAKKAAKQIVKVWEKA